MVAAVPDVVAAVPDVVAVVVAFSALLGRVRGGASHVTELAALL